MPIINTSFFQTGTNTSDATATASQILAPYTAYVASGKVTGTIQTRTQATPSISVSSGGLITATSTQQTGYVSGGTKTATRQLSTQGAQTITPGTSNQTIPSGKYLTGTQTILGDSDLVASNIKSGVRIFGVTGTYSGSGGGSIVHVPSASISYSSSSRFLSVSIPYSTQYFWGELSAFSSSGDTVIPFLSYLANVTQQMVTIRCPSTAVTGASYVDTSFTTSSASTSFSATLPSGWGITSVNSIWFLYCYINS